MYDLIDEVEMFVEEYAQPLAYAVAGAVIVITYFLTH